MKLHIGDDYYITSDRYGWQCRKYEGTYTNKGKEMEDWTILGYYSSFENAIKAYVELKLRLSDADDFIQAIAEAHEICVRLNEMLVPHYQVTTQPQEPTSKQ